MHSETPFSGVSVYFCVSVCVSLMDAQTVRPIFPELGKGIEGHLAGNIGYVSCALVNEGLRERRRKEGGSIGAKQRKNLGNTLNN